MDEIKTCCVCGAKFTGWGNNPYPLKEDGECCDECNRKVVALRFLQVQNRPVPKAVAVLVAMWVNGVAEDVAERYTDGELKEVLGLLKIKANF